MTSRMLLKLIPAIVAVASTAHAQSTSELFDRVSGSVCTIAAIDEDDNLLRRGSGFVLRDGRLVTNAHVLAGFQRAEVKCGEQIASVTKITNYDGEVDLLIAEVTGLNVPGLELSGQTSVRPGTEVYAFGSPYGLEGTITPGLSSAYRDLQGHTYLQISTPISPGSSGGPVTDGRGSVIGVTVAALEVAQNINFAIPAAAVRALPSVDLELAAIAAWRGASPPPPTFDPAMQTGPAVRTDGPSFRGYAFGSQCGEIAIAEYEGRLMPYNRKGKTRFNRTYGGDLILDVELLGAPATAVFSCSERFGLVSGHYEISGVPDVIVQLEGELTKEYGAGVPTPISEPEATEMGCLFNFSFPGSRMYRPSQRTTWNVQESMRVDLLICGGNSRSAFVFFGDPGLADTVARAEAQAASSGR